MRILTAEGDVINNCKSFHNAVGESGTPAFSLSEGDLFHSIFVSSVADKAVSGVTPSLSATPIMAIFTIRRHSGLYDIISVVIASKIHEVDIHFMSFIFESGKIFNSGSENAIVRAKRPHFLCFKSFLFKFCFQLFC